MKFLLINIMLLMFCTCKVSIAQEIAMKQGIFKTTYYQDDSKISKSEFETLIRNDEDSNKLWEKNKRQDNLSLVARIAAAGFGILYASKSGSDEAVEAPAVGLIASTALYIGLSFSAKANRKRAISAYNQNQERSSYYIKPAKKGLGIAFQF